MTTPRRRSNFRRVLPWLIAPGACAALIGTYLASPAFYSTYVIDAEMREYQAVEITTFTTSTLAGIMLLWSAWMLGRRRPAVDPEESMVRRLAEGWGAAGIVGVAGAASLLFAGEEVNWGQTFLHWGVPESEKPHPTSLHNNDNEFAISVNQLGALYLIGQFIVLPLVWRFRDRWRLPIIGRVPDSWRAAIPEAPVIFTFIVSVLWKLIKDLYERPENPGEDAFWDGFVWQINEHKEMLVGITLLLMYAFYRVAAARRLVTHEPPAAE